jgi:hypothetical protein
MPAAAPTARAPQYSTNTAKPDNKRKFALFAGAGAAVVVVAVIVFLVLNSGGGGGAANNQAGQSASSAPSATGSASKPSPTTTSSAPNVASNGKVEWQPAGKQVIAFYSKVNSDPASAWAMLTADAQAVYGDQGAFQTFWSQHPLSGYGGANAYKRANNDDGSVDIQITLEHKGGSPETKTVRVIDSGGGNLQISGDTRSNQSASTGQ